MVGASSAVRSLGKLCEAEDIAERAKEILQVLSGDNSYETTTATEEVAEVYLPWDTITRLLLFRVISSRNNSINLGKIT
jgi:hypothetical protein